MAHFDFVLTILTKFDHVLTHLLLAENYSENRQK